jgi:hypothetical protein
MPTGAAEIFPWWRIALDAVIATAVCFFVLWASRGSRKRHADRHLSDELAVAGIVGLSVLGWRSFSNVPAFNQDALPAISPGDALSPVWTYVCLQCYTAFRHQQVAMGWETTRAFLVLLSFLINVVVI